jgi:hypothetical protein
MAETQRTLTLAIKADIEAARTQLEQLVGIMGSSATQVDDRLNRIEDSFSRTSQSISRKSQLLATTIGSTIGTTLGTLLGRVPGELLAIGRAAVESASSIKNQSEALGIGTDALQDFRLGAAKVGVDVSKADTALESFQKTTGKAANGNKAAADSFKAIGVDIADSNGRLKPFEVLLGEVADGLAKVPDPARQAAAAQKLFGETGVALLPFLREGSKGINDLAAANELLGIKLSKETIDNLDTLGNKADAVGKVMTAQMATAIGQNADAIIALGNAAGEAVGYMASLLAYAKGLAEIRANEGFLGQFTSDFDRTTALGKAGGPVQVYGREYVEAKRRRENAEASGLPSFLNGAAMLRAQETEAHARYSAALAAQESRRTVGTTPAVVGGIVTPVAVRPPPGSKARATKPGKRIYTDAELRVGFDKVDPNVPTLANASAALVNLEAIDARLGEIATSVGDVSQMEIFDPQAIAAGEAFLADMAFGLASIITQSGDVGDKVINVFSRIGEAWIQSGLMNFLSGGRQGTSFGTLFSSISGLFGGARADGGPVMGGVPYLVGERGPEIVVPGMSGSVIPNHALRVGSGAAGGRGAIYQTFDLRGALVTEDVMARIDAAAGQAAVRGAMGGKALAADDRARQARRRLA